MSNILLSATNDTDSFIRLCKTYNDNIINNSYSEVDVGNIYYKLVQLHQCIRDISSLKSIYVNYKHIQPLPNQLYKIILDVVCKENVKKFTLNYNTLYNHLLMFMSTSSK